MAAAIFFASLSPSAAAEATQNASADKMHRLINEILKEDSQEKKLDETKELAWLIKDHKNLVDSDTIDGLIKLVGKEDSSVRTWAVMSLGEIGPRASGAIPVLRAALDTENCEWKSQSSTPAIVTALKKIGITVKDPCY